MGMRAKRGREGKGQRATNAGQNEMRYDDVILHFWNSLARAISVLYSKCHFDIGTQKGSQRIRQED